MSRLFNAILKINPNAKVTIRGDNIEWLDGTTPISQSDIEAQYPAVDLDKALDDLRAKRNKLLADTDYTVLQDSTYTDEQVAEWVIYRQALRDITNGITTVEQANNVTWPTKP